MGNISKEVQNAFVNICEFCMQESDAQNDLIIVAKALGFTDKQMEEDLCILGPNEDDVDEGIGEKGDYSS